MGMGAHRVELSKNVSLEPYTVLKKGERGTIVHVERDADGVYEADVLMDSYHKGLSPWDNVAHLVEPELSALKDLSSKNRNLTVALEG